MTRVSELSLTLVQTTTHWHDPAANRSHFDELLQQVPAHAAMVLLPEMFSTGFTMASTEVAEDMQGPTVTWLRARAQAYGKVLCGSLVILAAGQYFNRFLVAMPDGTLHTYDKRHRFRMAGEHQHYSAGAQRLVFELGGWKVCPQVCYDLRFPVWLRNQGEYDLLVCVANWPSARQSAWNTLLRARAIENQAYVAGVNIVGRDGNDIDYGGGSAVYAPDGAILEEAGEHATLVTQTLSYQRLDTLRRTFPVWQDADSFTLMAPAASDPIKE